MSNTTRLPGSPYDLGYGKPPKDSQFAAGRSGNPKGRPKGSANLAAALNRALKEKVEIVEHGRRKSITKLDAAVKAMVNRAVKGDAKAMQQMLGMAPLVGMDTSKSTQSIDANDAVILQALLQRMSGGAEPPDDLA
jgi:hypothetical protein